MKRILSFLAIAALAALAGCSSSGPIVVPEARYTSAFHAVRAKAASLGYEAKKVDEARGEMTLDKVCGCSRLVVTFAKDPAAGARLVTFSGTALFGAFHVDVDEVRKAARQAAETR